MDIVIYPRLSYFSDIVSLTTWGILFLDFNGTNSLIYNINEYII